MGKESKEGEPSGGSLDSRENDDSEAAPGPDPNAGGQTGSRKKRRKNSSSRSNATGGSASPQQDGPDGELVIHVDGDGDGQAHAGNNQQQPDATGREPTARPATAPAAIGKTKSKTSVLAGSIILIDDTRELTQDADIARLIRPPRYFDDDDDGSLVAITHRCFNCGQVRSRCGDDSCSWGLLAWHAHGTQTWHCSSQLCFARQRHKIGIDLTATVWRTLFHVWPSVLPLRCAAVQIGHRSIECTNAARLKPCHLCAQTGHEGRDCPNSK